jgi:uncharacterized protein (DUF1697 family)
MDSVVEFEMATGILINPPRALIEGGSGMAQMLDGRLSAAGCVSTRVRVLVSRYPGEMEVIVERMEKLAQAVQGNDAMEEELDGICVTWYLSDIADDVEALRKLKSDVERLEAKIRV